MSDGWVWLRCKGCGSNIRLVVFSGGDWGLWDHPTIAPWVVTHSSEFCHGNKIHDPNASAEGYSFFELVTEKQADETGGVNSKANDKFKTRYETNGTA